jgi:glycerol-3-phosphate dehydrogenase (NAD(P)+)
MENKSVVSIIGGGSFGTALAVLLSKKHDRVNVWLRNLEAVNDINTKHENPIYAPGFSLPENIFASSNLEEVINDVDLIFLTLPSKSFRQVTKEIGKYIQPNQILITTTKGFEQGSFKSMSEIIAEETCCLKIGALSGPNLAHEILEGKPCGTVIGSHFDEVIETVQKALGGKDIRVYGNHDIYGVELAGTLKNIYAICSGILHTMGFGENTKSLMIARALSEMSRFAYLFNANPSTFLGVSGVGDLIATCNSEKSRNFRIGRDLSQGKTIEEAIASLGQVAEGVGMIKVVKEKADELCVDMPIVNAMYRIVYEKESIKSTLDNLMSMSQKTDVEYKFAKN